MSELVNACCVVLLILLFLGGVYYYHFYNIVKAKCPQALVCNKSGSGATTAGTTGTTAAGKTTTGTAAAAAGTAKPATTEGFAGFGQQGPMPPIGSPPPNNIGTNYIDMCASQAIKAYDAIPDSYSKQNLLV
jgi:hypothetical protein